jgi:hypothetical protein
MLVNRFADEVRPKFDLAFGKRPAEELYDLRTDPCYMRNVADDPSYSDTVRLLSTTLLEILEKHNDPRVAEKDCRFEQPPYAGHVPAEWYEGRHNDAVWTPPIEY